MSHISKEILMRNTQWGTEMQPVDSKGMLVLSLGTGASKHEERYSAVEASKWGFHNWAYNNGAAPILDIFSHASSDMVDFHVSTLFQSLSREKNYLRIQVCMHQGILIFHSAVLDDLHDHNPVLALMRWIWRNRMTH